MPPSLSAFGGLLFSVIAFVYSLLKASANGKEQVKLKKAEKLFRVNNITPVKVTALKRMNECFGGCDVCCNGNVVNVAKS